MSKPKFIVAHRPDPNRRTTSDSVWPLRGADGLTWAERKARKTAEGVGS
jgi:hypothetical protein